MKLPDHWQNFIKIFQKKFDAEIVYDTVRIFQDEEAVIERYTTYGFDADLPAYIPVADDSGGQVAVISRNNEDTKVYLTSYGTLQEKDFRILDRDLLHWMQRKFPFDQGDEREKKITAEQQSLFEKDNEQLKQKVNRFPSLLNFWKHTYPAENLSLPENYPVLEDLLAFQDGYAFNAVSGESLTGEKEGDFKESWLVIARNYFADPFFIDFNDSEDNFPVYFAFHGAGTWEPVKISDDIESFQETLRQIYEHRLNQNNLLILLQQLSVSGNEFWDEVYRNALEMPDQTEEEQNQMINDSDWREAEIYITDIGPNKMKIVSLLKEKYRLSGTEALQMSKSNRILYGKGIFKWMKTSIMELENLGATLEIVML
ncbi:MAG: SMI1/KNR4 family protein [Chryseobacterium sp.]|jgi:hypothetical protein|uniref:SMI1/KNR4 family protein n=1 Tax=Chryseobacterium sp. TaxID=1871047 RepID=UPI002822067F|nr:SMI1/KNR4 family protein [Chryseobacterium sp.]MDR2236760.1 SMI1/KNR4 family protein [Chryseobacterium sp.]